MIYHLGSAEWRLGSESGSKHRICLAFLHDFGRNLVKDRIVG
jgi:hypothetical protein